MSVAYLVEGTKVVYLSLTQKNCLLFEKSKFGQLSLCKVVIIVTTRCQDAPNSTLLLDELTVFPDLLKPRWV